MNLQQIEAIENRLIRNVFATCWNFAEEVEDYTAYGCCDTLKHYALIVMMRISYEN